MESLRRRRLLTLTGPGGVGKTRLAVEIGWSVVDAFPDGVWLADLAAVGDPEAVLAAVASQPGLSMVESIVDCLRSQRLLLIVDNCAHVLAAVIPLVRAVVHGCPHVVVLATSREPLAVSEECVYPISPLDPSSEALDLFCERAMAADESFSPRDDDRAIITAICQRPGRDAVGDRVGRGSDPRPRSCRSPDPPDDRFGFLGDRHRGGLPRHQTLRATVEWSYQLLSEQERLLFDRISVFAGGFDLDGAVAVCADGVMDDLEDLDMVSSLVEKSMVILDRHGEGARYHLLETLRQYGYERLGEQDEILRRRDAHLAHFVDVATRARRLWASSRQVDADALFDREWDNLRAAHAWAVSNGNLDAADVLVDATGPHAWCRARLEHGGWAARTRSWRLPTPTRARARTVRCLLGGRWW